MKPVKIQGQRLSVFICTIKRLRMVTINGAPENDCDEIRALLSLDINSDRVPRLGPTMLIDESFEYYPITVAIIFYMAKPYEADVSNKLSMAFDDVNGNSSPVGLCEGVVANASNNAISVAYLIDKSDIRTSRVGTILPFSLTDINTMYPVNPTGCRIKIPQIIVGESGITLHHPVFPDDELGFIKVALEHFEVQSRNRRRAAATALENMRF